VVFSPGAIKSNGTPFCSVDPVFARNDTEALITSPSPQKKQFAYGYGIKAYEEQ